MKKITLSLFILCSAIMVSACSIIPGTTTTTTKKSPSLTDGGIFKSLDFGDHWTQKASLVTADGKPAGSISNVEPRFISFDPKDIDTVYLSTNGNGVYKSIDDGETWMATTLNTGTYTSISIDVRNNKVAYVIKANSIIKTVDGMATWFPTYVESRPSQQLVSVIDDPAHPNIVYAASTTSIIKSKNYGNDWDLTDWKKPTISQLYLSKKNSNTLFAVTNTGLLKSTDAAATWTDITTPLITKFPGINTIYWFTLDPTMEAIVMGTKFGIMKSTDSGATWSEVQTLFEHKKISINPVIYNPANELEVLFSIGNVIQQTNDGGVTWSSLKSISTTRTIHYLANDPNQTNTVFAGTQKPKQ